MTDINLSTTKVENVKWLADNTDDIRAVMSEVDPDMRGRDISSTIDSNRKAISQLKSKYEKEIKDIRDDISSMATSGTIENIQDKLSSLSNKHDTDIRDLRDQISSMPTLNDIKSIENDVQTLYENDKSLSDSISDLRSSLSVNESDISELNSKVSGVQNDVNDVSSRVDSAVSRIDTNVEDIDFLKDRIKKDPIRSKVEDMALDRLKQTKEFLNQLEQDLDIDTSPPNCLFDGLESTRSNFADKGGYESSVASHMESASSKHNKIGDFQSTIQTKQDEIASKFDGGLKDDVFERFRSKSQEMNLLFNDKLVDERETLRDMFRNHSDDADFPLMMAYAMYLTFFSRDGGTVKSAKWDPISSDYEFDGVYADFFNKIEDVTQGMFKASRDAKGILSDVSSKMRTKADKFGSISAREKGLGNNFSDLQTSFDDISTSTQDLKGAVEDIKTCLGGSETGGDAPATPTLSGSASDMTVNLSWNNVDNATTYMIYESVDGEAYTALTEVTDTSYSKTVGFPGTYAYKVMAKNEYGTSEASNSVSFDLTGGDGTEVPTSVTGLSVSKDSDNNIDLSWDSVGNATSYVIYHAKGDGEYTQLTEETTTSYNYSNPGVGTHYFYVTALNSAGESDPSGEVSIIIKEDVIISDLDGVADNYGQITLTWASRGADAEYYNVYRDGNKVATKNVTSYTDNDVQASTSYTYEVSGVNARDSEGPKKAVSVTTPSDSTGSKPAKVESLSANFDGSMNVVKLNWDPNPDDDEVDEYRIYESRDGSKYSLKSTVDGGTTSAGYNERMGETQQVIYYYVTAVNNVGEGEPSNEASVIIPGSGGDYPTYPGDDELKG